jgi:membrane protease YdiL (CAAX protease family)
VPILQGRYFTTDFQYVFFFKIPGLLVIPGIWYFRTGYAIRDLLPDWRWERRTVLLTLFAFFVGVSVNGSNVAPISGAIRSFSWGQIALRLACGAAVALVDAGIPEEFVYRGLLQTRVEAVYGRPLAIIGAAILFTAWHLPTRLMLASGSEGRAGNVASVLLHTGLPVLIVALIFGMLWDRYRRLVPLIALHWGVDLLPLTAELFGIAL